MGKTKTKAVFAIRTRQDMSNPYHKIPHKELLKLAGVEDISNNHKIVNLPDGKIRVEKADLNQ